MLGGHLIGWPDSEAMENQRTISRLLGLMFRQEPASTSCRLNQKKRATSVNDRINGQTKLEKPHMHVGTFMISYFQCGVKIKQNINIMRLFS